MFLCGGIAVSIFFYLSTGFAWCVKLLRPLFDNYKSGVGLCQTKIWVSSNESMEKLSGRAWQSHTAIWYCPDFSWISPRFTQPILSLCDRERTSTDGDWWCAYLNALRRSSRFQTTQTSSDAWIRNKGLDSILPANPLFIPIQESVSIKWTSHLTEIRNFEETVQRQSTNLLVITLASLSFG